MRLLIRLALLFAVVLGVARVVSTDPDLRRRLPWESAGDAVQTEPVAPVAVPAPSVAPVGAIEGFTTHPTNQGGASAWELTALRTGRNDGFDRVVLDAAGPAPLWRATLDLDGDGARIWVTTPKPTAEEGIDPVGCEGDADARLQAVERCRWTFDGDSATLEVQLDRVAPYRVQVVDQSIAVDVWASGEAGDAGTPQDAVRGFVFAWDQGSRTEMRDYATAAVLAEFADGAIEGSAAMDAPSCTGVGDSARCEDVWVYEDFEDHTATVGYYTFDLRVIDGAWWITRITCDDIYGC